MKNNVPHKRYFAPDVGWNIWECKFRNRWGRYNHKNGKRYWLNIFNRKLRRFFRKKIKEEQ